jgi:4-amino-4-deoxy-L-arabinose transferase-like glycosyltransferase
LRARAARVVQGASGRSPGERATLWGLVIVLAAYLALGALYAAMTPAWQVPDEPAHYNYVKYVAEHGQLPELRVGDYTADYLEQIKSQRFPPSLSIEPIRYESHQPPLYYVSAAIVYRLGQGLLGQAGSDRELAVLLRIFSMLIGGITLVVSYRIVRRVYAEEPLLALGTAAFMAFLPMHLAMNAGVNNDSLSELMLVLVVWRLVAMDGVRWSWRSTLAVGLLLGLALLTKMQAYVAVGVALFALGWDVLAARRRAAPRSEATEFTWPQVLARAGVMLGIALAVVSPWLVRNMRLYGPADPLGMVRHDQVVMGQLTTQQFVDQYGVGKLVDDLVVTTFHSFWGQFGWMGVLLHERIYMTLLVATMLVGAGLALYVKSLHSQLGTHSEQSRRGMALLFVWALGTTLVYLWYNTKYVQHQGRYLFPALTSWGLVFTLGLCTILRRRPIPTLIALGAVLAFLVAYGAWRGDIKEFYVALTVAAAAAIAAGHWLEERRPGAAMGLAYLGLCGLALLCLYVYVVPNLQPPA